MRLNPWRVIIPLVLAAVAFAVVGLHAAAPTSCEDANQARTHWLLTQAQKEYTAILADEPTSDCAREGLANLGRQLCQRADRLALKNDKPRPQTARDQAKAIYTSVLKIEPGGAQRDCAYKGLKRLPPPDDGGDKSG